MTDRATLQKTAQIFMSILEGSARDFQRVLKEVGFNNKIGFAVLVFDFGSGGNLGWVSNAQRETMIETMKEFIEKKGGSNIFSH